MKTISDVVFDKSFLSISLVPEAKIIHLKWKGYSTSEQFREGLNAALELVQEHGIEYWLGNLKLMQVILSGDEEWATTEWYPLIVKTKVKKMAIVTSLDYFNNSTVKRIVERSEPVTNFETRYFVDVNEAYEWLTLIS